MDLIESNFCRIDFALAFTRQNFSHFFDSLFYSAFYSLFKESFCERLIPEILESVFSL